MTTVQDILDQFGKESVKIVQDNMQRAGQNATGKTSASIRSELSRGRVQVTAPGYIYVLEDGRSPRRSSTESNFKSKLEEWVQARGIRIPGKTLQQTVRSLQYLINKRGTKLYRQGGRKDIITPIFADRRIDELTDNIADALVDNAVLKIDNIISG